MRVMLFLLICFPLFTQAQINRSANELARERVREYIITKIFRDGLYQPGNYSPLKELKQPQSEISWSIRHRFEIVDSQFVADKKIAVRTTYYFSFYLDKKLKVVAAESYYRE